MSTPRIGRQASPLVVDQARTRKTAKPANPFKEVLRGGANVLLSGARVATRVVGLPTLSAAVTSAARRAPAAGQGRIGLDAMTGGSAGAPAANSPTQALGGQLAGHADGDLQLLALQEQIQRHNRQIALMSNVMKARHDTAKAAIANMRS